MAQVLLADRDTDVKYILSQLSGLTTYDNLLNFIIKGLSGNGDVTKLGGFEQYCGRIFAAPTSGSTYTEYFSSDGSRTKVPVLAYPISSITNIWVDNDRSFGSDTLLDTSDYVADQHGGPWIRLKWTSFAAGTDHIKVTYAGGLSSTVAGMPDDLRLACALQTAYIFQRRDELGLTGISGGAGNLSLFTPASFLPIVRQLLDPYRRMI